MEREMSLWMDQAYQATSRKHLTLPNLSYLAHQTIAKEIQHQSSQTLRAISPLNLSPTLLLECC